MPLSTLPLVAVSATIESSAGLRRVRINESYLDALEATGLTPVVVPPLSRAGAAARVLASARGLVLTGGEDVEPARYGQRPHQALGTTNPIRDAWEVALLEVARLRQLPVLAICRGLQLLNVALGGTLIQDIPSLRRSSVAHEPENGRGQRVHQIEIERPSRLADALGATGIAVNSVHHQAIDRLAPGLRPVARSPDGLIEGVEVPDDDWWVVGVQWHPEDLAREVGSADQALFAAFALRVRAAD